MLMSTSKRVEEPGKIEDKKKDLKQRFRRKLVNPKTKPILCYCHNVINIYIYVQNSCKGSFLGTLVVIGFKIFSFSESLINTFLQN